MDDYVQHIERALGDKRSVREDLQGQVHDLEIQIARLEGALDVLNGKTYPERTTRLRAAQADGAESNGKSPATKRTRQKNGYARSVAYELLQGTGDDGMHIRELLTALEEKGAAPKGASKRASLQSQLESDSRFERHQPATYRIAAGTPAEAPTEA